jgi:cysteine desulfurase
MKRIYLDHTATTPLDPRVAAAMEPYGAHTFGNPSSVHSYGREARTALEQARSSIAASLGARPGEIFFTSGGTEADNLAIAGAARAARRRGRNGIVTTASEHHAVLDACLRLQAEGSHLTILPVDAHGLVSPAQVAAAVTDDTALVSVMHGNNEVGSLSPVGAIAEIAHTRGALMHTDAVQTAGKIPVDVTELGADLLTLSAHKLYGPKGIGVLCVGRTVEIDPLVFGGGQERGTRPGTENVAAAVGCATALGLAVGEMGSESQRLALLRDALQAALMLRFPALLVNGHPDHRLPHILNISFDNRKQAMEGEMLVMNMDLRGIAVSSGSACTSGSIQPSHVLLAMGRDAATARATLRFAFGRSNTEEDIPAVVEALSASVAQMTAAQ